MRFMRRSGFVSVLALAGVAMWGALGSVAAAQGPTVMFMDNDAPTPNQAVDERQSAWGFGPAHLVVKKGDQVTFVSPPENKRPHSATSITLSGGSFDGSLAIGARFDSSPNRETLVTPGNSWTLDTGTLDPGNYAYYCRLHPWMVGELTILPE